MANLSLRQIYKVYKGAKKKKINKSEAGKVRSGDFTAVQDFNMEIEDGEFIVFVGPSGCGKSTTLRMIAGLEEITSGELYIGDTLVNDVEPKDRDIAMVFQSYALYPHMTAYQNISFGLKIGKTPAVERDKSTLVKDKKGKPKFILFRLFGKTLKEQTDEDGNILTDADGNPLYVVKRNKAGEEIKNKKGEPVFEKRGYNDDEKYGAIIKGEDGKPVLIAKKDKDGNIKLDKTGKPVFKMRKWTKQEIDAKVRWAAKVLGVEDLLQSKPAAMSGGQRQRIALGRAMVREPKVFLLDEPLSNLDAKLRTTMRSEIVNLHESLKATFIYVTHDQVEAMTMGTRIVVMKLGIVQQIDTPTNLFDYPENKFVAGFIGTPQMNFFDVKAKRVKDNLALTFANGESISLDLYKMRKIREDLLDGQEHSLVLGVRGEHINVSEKGLTLSINITELLGSETHLFAELEGAETKYIICLKDRAVYYKGDKIKVSFNESKIHLFDTDDKSVLDRETAQQGCYNN